MPGTCDVSVGCQEAPQRSHSAIAVESVGRCAEREEIGKQSLLRLVSLDNSQIVALALMLCASVFITSFSSLSPRHSSMFEFLMALIMRLSRLNGSNCYENYTRLIIVLNLTELFSKVCLGKS